MMSPAPLPRGGSAQGLVCSVPLRIVPISFREASAFIKQLHRHHPPPRGMKFAIGCSGLAGRLVGVATAGRPVARCLDDGVTLEVNRTCTDGTKNANSMLYGAARRVGVAMGYARILTYTENGESGATMRACGFRLDKTLEPRGNWAQSSLKLRSIRKADARSDVGRLRWVWP